MHPLMVPNSMSRPARPLAFRIQGKKTGTLRTIALPIEEPSVIPEEMFHVTETVIGNMNIVLEKIVPGLIIAVKALGSQLMPNGSAGKRIELVSSLDSIKTCNKQGICLSPGKPGEFPGFTV